jgi:predicted ATPase/class 3 adenylate cyclase
MTDRHEALPTGTVTLLFTDIEGSTRLLSEYGSSYADLLAEHRRVLRETFQRHGGVEVDTQGDSFLYAFSSARGAARAAVDGQTALGAGPIRVRMGLHTGEPEITTEGYVGLDVHRAARVMGAAHGGQVLLSQTTRDLVDGEPVDLGEHRLKDLLAPIRLWQLGTGGFPPLATLHQTNLPTQNSPLIGREKELAEAAELLRRRRLLTFTGPGGSGKTRLALQVAAESVEAFPDGVWWLSLAAVTDPRLVVPTIAQVLGIRGSVGAYLRSRRLLLVLDNLEQVIESAPDIADLLAGAADIRIIVTSREPLRLDGEFEFAVEPMAEAEAIALFVERASISEPREAVVAICRRLDRLPLAVELAAARTTLLSPADLLARLDDHLGLLTGGRRDAPARQRTLRATIEWSHDLLNPAERELFRDLGVFRGGFTLDAAESVSGADPDILQSLVEQNLVVRRVQSGRFGMLESIGAFARELLDLGETGERRRAAHASYYLTLAETIAPDLLGSEQTERLAVLEEDSPNMRRAIAWALDRDHADLALRFGIALMGFWLYHSHIAEGRHWLEDALAADERMRQEPSPESDRRRIGALRGASILATLQGDWAVAELHGREGLEIARRLGEERHVAEALLMLGRPALARGDPDGARTSLVDAVEHGRRAEADWLVAMATFNLAYVSLAVKEFPRAHTEMTLALERFRPLTDRYGIARSLTGLGAVAVHRDDLAEAIEPLREALVTYLELGDREGPAWALELLGDAMAATDADIAARLLGAAEGLRLSLEISLVDTEIEPHERALGRLGRSLGADELASAWADGQRLTLEEAIGLALDRTPASQTGQPGYP